MSQYDETYFMRGKQVGVSLYENYRWMPNLTIPMAQAIVKHLGIQPDHTILDFGCARGYLVKALRQLRYDCWGVDRSEWAIANADPEVKDFVFLPDGLPRYTDRVGWVIAKDVLEHVPDVVHMIHDLMQPVQHGVFAVVPLAKVNVEKYVVDEYEKDVTHIHRWTLPTWASFFMLPGWSVDTRYRIPGIKDNYAQYKMGNGFITARRTAE